MIGWLLYIYYVLALTSTPINRFLLGDAGDFISVSYIPLSLLMVACLSQSLSMRIPRGFAQQLVWLLVITLIAAFHLLHDVNVFLLKYPLFLLFALAISRSITEEQIENLVKLTFSVACLYFAVGSVLWYINVYGQLLTGASFMRAMLFHKQDYTIVFTLLSGVFLYDLLMCEKHVQWRRRRMLISSIILATGVVFFYIKTLLVVGALSVVGLYVLGVRSARRYVLVGSLVVLSVYAMHELIIELGILPDHIAGYVAWMFDERLLSVEGARYVDSLGMRMAIFSENIAAFTASFSDLMFGVGQNTAVNVDYFSEASGRTHSLPSQLESGVLTVLIYTGVTGFVGYLSMYGSGFASWRRVALRCYPGQPPMFAAAVAINVAMFASNIFQDNLSSVTWCWLGVLWHYAHKESPKRASARTPAWQSQGHQQHGAALARRS